MSRYQRTHDGAEQKTTTLELFYDLVFVFAITQVSHFLLEHLTWEGAGQATLVLLVVWWSWNYTTWVTNELDPEAIAVRLLLIGLMLASFLMAIAIPEAFGDRALLFAGAYVVIQVGRHTFLTFAAAGPGTIERERSGRILIWFLVAAVFWIAGGIADGPLRTVLWLIGLAIDYAGPLCTFWVPGMKRVPMSAWELETSHFAERFQLFVILALGESIVVTGATTAGDDLDAARLASFAVAFLGTAAMWWLYFDYAAAIAQRRLELATNRTQMARDAYTYLHVVMVAGVIVAAVGDEVVIAHPDEALHGAELVGRLGRSRDLPARPGALPAADGRDAEHQAPRRRGRLRAPRADRRKLRRPRPGRAARRGARGGDRRRDGLRPTPARPRRTVPDGGAAIEK